MRDRGEDPADLRAGHTARREAVFDEEYEEVEIEGNAPEWCDTWMEI